MAIERWHPARKANILSILVGDLGAPLSRIKDEINYDSTFSVCNNIFLLGTTMIEAQFHCA
jgi:hypothetical protein